MGDVADMILDGTLCQSCGVFIGEGEGFPRECAYCRRAGKAAGKVACPVCKKKVKGLNDHIRDAHPGHAEREKATQETATRDMLESARADLEVIRDALGVPIEPHQSLIERMVEAARAKRGAVPQWDAEGEPLNVTAAMADAEEWLSLIDRLHNDGKGPWKFSDRENLSRLRACRRSLQAMMKSFATPAADHFGDAAEMVNARVVVSMLTFRVGRKAAGRLLDGRTHDGFPEVPPDA